MPDEPGLVVLPELLPEPMLPLEPVLPEVEPPVLPEPVVLAAPDVAPEVLPDPLPYCLMQSSRCVPVRPTHWLGVADGLEVLLLDEGELLDPAPLDPAPLDPLPELPALGAVVDEPPVLLLPELWAIDTD